MTFEKAIPSRFRGRRAMFSMPTALSVALVAVGCGGAAHPVSTTPAGANAAPGPSSVSVSAAPNDPFAVDGLVREEWLPLLKGPEPAFNEVAFPDTPKNVPPPPPASCDAFVKRPTKSKALCTDKPKALALLDTAMNGDASSRDRKLAELESCTAFAPGVVRALRIELAPPECGDAMAEPFLKKKPEGTPGAIHHTLVGLALAARLGRTVASPPKLEAPYSKQRVTEFVKGPMMTWFTSQAKAVEDLARMGSQLSYYGKGVVALAAGTADLRLVDALREVPIPDEFKTDPDLANAYYASLDEALEPRKLRGRDGALVGLKEMALAGIISDARTDAARGLLAKLYGGRKVDALDAVALPKAPASTPATPVERLAATLPTFYAGLLLDPEVATQPSVLRAFLARGVPVTHRALLKEKDGTLTDEARSAYARARLLLGIRYWRAEDFDAAAVQLSKIPRAKLAPEDKLLFAIALGLRNGPDDVAALMQKEGFLSVGFGRTAALDVVGGDSQASSTQGLGAYDAAVITQIALPRGSEPSAWAALAKRYDDAAPLLDDPRRTWRRSSARAPPRRPPKQWLRRKSRLPTARLRRNPEARCGCSAKAGPELAELRAHFTCSVVMIGA